MAGFRVTPVFQAVRQSSESTALPLHDASGGWDRSRPPCAPSRVANDIVYYQSLIDLNSIINASENIACTPRDGGRAWVSWHQGWRGRNGLAQIAREAVGSNGRFAACTVDDRGTKIFGETGRVPGLGLARCVSGASTRFREARLAVMGAHGGSVCNCQSDLRCTVRRVAAADGQPFFAAANVV